MTTPADPGPGRRPRDDAAETAFEPRAAAGLALPSGEIQLWAVALDPPPEVVESLGRSLAPDEWERARRFRFERHRRRYVVGRGALRALLGGYLGILPREVAFSYGARGKPFLAGPAATASALSFNLSNSHELALVGFLRGQEIGVDVEHLKPMPDLEQIAERFFSPSERLALRRLPALQKPEGFFNCWTRKEAYLKARGEGIATGLRDVSVSFAEAPTTSLTDRRDSSASAWRLHALPMPEGYAGCAACDDAERLVMCLSVRLDKDEVQLEPFIR